MMLTGCHAAVHAAAVNCGPAAEHHADQADHRNIVFVLADDLSNNLLPFMPHVQALAQLGTSFSNYTVTDSLCCPSRASIFTGEFPHDTGIFTNTAPNGGFKQFLHRRDQTATFNVALARAGYRTAMMGKYLNGYRTDRRYLGSRRYIPPGWTEWDVAGDAYREFDYRMNEDGVVVKYGHEPRDYLTTVLTSRASAFITACAAQHAPFFLEVATFAPHAPYVPAPADAGSLTGLRAPRSVPFNRLPLRPPAWLPQRGPFTRGELAQLDEAYRLRAESVLSIDRMLGSIQATLAETGQAANTDVFFSSDNGYHIGQYRLLPGKRTAYDTDIRVPLVAAGPDIRPAQSVSRVAQNIDLAPTFEALAGVRPPPTVDGRSLRPLLANRTVRHWRAFALVEHRATPLVRADPDALDGKGTADPPSYEALRTGTYTYVEYAGGDREFYNRVADPYEMVDIAALLPPLAVRQLHDVLNRLDSCHGARECWRAAARRAMTLPLPLVQAGTHRCGATTFSKGRLTRSPVLRCRGQRPSENLHKG